MTDTTRPGDQQTNDSHGMDTQAIHVGEGFGNWGAHVNPIYQTTTFLFDSMQQAEAVFSRTQPGYFYTRSGNPNRTALAQKIAALEGYGLRKRALAGGSEPPPVKAEIFSSGMGAISTVLLGLLKAGDHLVAHESLYGTADHFISEILPRYGMDVSRPSCLDLAALQRALEARPNTRVVYIESPTNPLMNVIDIRAVSELAHAHGARVVIDNTFATPALQRPLELGADIVVHSTTKYLGGHGAAVGGAIVTAEVGFVETVLTPQLRFMGTSPSPFDCWLTYLGTKTLPLRMRQHCANALYVAEHLRKHPRVSGVRYPGLPDAPQHELAKQQMSGFGGMLAFEITGGYPACRRFMDRVKLCGFGVSLGNVDSLIEYPAGMTHRLVPPEVRQRIGLTDGLVRLSVGLENPEDILADLEQALG